MATGVTTPDPALESQPMAARVRSAIIWRSGSQLVGQLAMWTSTFLVIRLLAPADYGLFAMTQVVLALAQLMNGYSFAGALVQREAIDDRHVSQVFGVLIVMNFGLAAAQFALAPIAAGYYRAPLVADLLRVQSLLHLTTPFIIVPQALLGRRLNFRAQARVNLTAAALGAATAPILAYSGFGVWTLVLAPLVMFVTRAIGLQLVGRWWVRPSFDFRGAGALFGIGGAMLASDVFWFVQTQADVFIGGRALEAHSLGLYTEGLFLTQILLTKFIPPLNEVAFPAYARMQADRAAIARGFLKSVRLIMLAALPFYVGLFVTAEPFVLTVMGDHWAETIPIVRTLALAMPFAILQILYAPATNALGRAGVAATVSAAGALIMPVAFLVAVRFGPIGLAAAWLIGAPLMLVIASILSLPIIGVRARDLAAAAVPALCAALVMGAGVHVIDETLSPLLTPVVHLLLLVASGVALYVGALFILSRDSIREVRALVSRQTADA